MTERAVKVIARLPEELEAYMKEVWEILELCFKDKRPRTVKIYRHTFERWEEYIRGRHIFFKNTSVIRPSMKDILQYMEHLRKGKNSQGQPVSEESVQKTICNLRTMYGWLINAGLVQAPNPLAIQMNKAEKEERQPTRGMNWEKDVARMCRCWGDDYEERLKGAIINLMFGCALRRSELAKLLSVDIELHAEPSLTVRSTQKNKQTSHLPVPKFALEALRLYEQVRVTTGDLEFFVKANGEKVSDSYVRWVFKEGLERCGLPVNKYSCHSARATAITHLLDLGRTAREVKAFSRHASVQMVEQYDKRRYSVSENPGNDLDL